MASVRGTPCSCLPGALPGSDLLVSSSAGGGAAAGGALQGSVLFRCSQQQQQRHIVEVDRYVCNALCELLQRVGIAGPASCMLQFQSVLHRFEMKVND